MILFAKHAIMTIAIIVAVLATMFGLAGWASRDMQDMAHTKEDGLCTAIWSAVVLFFCVLVIVTLSGCRSIEGDGFSNRGSMPTTRACAVKDKFGHEVWFSIPINRPCPK